MLTKHDKYCYSTETIRGYFTMIIKSETIQFLPQILLPVPLFQLSKYKNTFGVYIKSENNVCMAIYM